MGDIYDHHEAMADAYVVDLGKTPMEPGFVDGFDLPDEFDAGATVETPARPKSDPKRPEAKRGRYTLPNPVSGKSKSWQRVTNFVKLTDDTYHLELWKQRNVVKGVALLAQAGRVAVDDVADKDVKADKDWLNNVATAAQDVADAYRLADEGTALHSSTELADYAGGDLNRVPVHHRTKVRMYLDALAAHGMTVAPDMIERVTASMAYEVAGKFDRVFRLADGSLVIGDLKTGDSLDLSFPSIAAQLDCYRDGINNTGVFDGRGYDTSLKVRDDFGIVVHLPSTRDEVTVYRVDLDQGRQINASNLTVRNARKIKAKHVSEVFQPTPFGAAEIEAHWVERLNAANDMGELVAVANSARSFGQWSERLANVARGLAQELSV